MSWHWPFVIATVTDVTGLKALHLEALHQPPYDPGNLSRELAEPTMSVTMTLSALLVCIDEAAAQILHRVCEELGIKVESCPDFARASIRLAQDRFDVVIVDGGSNSDVINLLRDTRMSRMNDATLAVAVVARQESIREMFSLGVNFALYKPVAYDRALSSLRAARAVMRKEKRKRGRAPVHTHATVDYANVQQEKATLINLAEDGMSVTFGKKLPPTSKVYFQFRLPGQSAAVRLSGQVIWQDWNGRAGVSFVDVPKSSRRLLTEFLDATLPREAQPDQLPDVTVDVEESMQQLATVSVSEQTHGEHSREDRSTENHAAENRGTEPRARAIQEVAAASAAESRPDPDNRRGQTRYACRLGAEVYHTGNSVPNRCCLTDLSSGGCYLENPLPFPSGASVEILVRTHEMKLRLRGTVQAAHPGFGMGVAFELKTKEERESVKKLTDFVAATTEPSN
jgi:DNA-binding NarL/FixJ family response regulator